MTTLQDYINKIKDFNQLDIQQEHALLKLIQSNPAEHQQEITELIKSNLKFVVFIAKRYINYGFTFEDLINEGNIGMLQAMLKFDLSKDIKFVTYAQFHIKNRIIQYMNKNRSIINIPSNKMREINNKHKKESRATKELRITCNSVFETNLSMLAVNELSIEDQLTKLTIIKLLKDNSSLRNTAIVIDRYGLNKEKPLTLLNLSIKYKLSKERVNQIVWNEIALLKRLLQ